MKNKAFGVDWYKDQLSKDIALYQSIISNIQTQILDFNLLLQLKQNTSDENEKISIEKSNKRINVM